MTAVILCRTSSIVSFRCQRSTVSASREGGEPAISHVMHPGMAAIPYLNIATDAKKIQLQTIKKY